MKLKKSSPPRFIDLTIFSVFLVRQVSGSFELFAPPQEGAGDYVTAPFSVTDILEENGVADFEIQSNPLD